MNNNDQRILELKEKIATKKAMLSKAKRFEPITTCILPFNGNDYNLHVIKKEVCENLLINLNMYRMSADNLGIDFKIAGFSLDDWMHDLNDRLIQLNLQEEKRKLADSEKKLSAMLSSDKKVELEIDSIAADLGI